MESGASPKVKDWSYYGIPLELHDICPITFADLNLLTNTHLRPSEPAIEISRTPSPIPVFGGCKLNSISPDSCNSTAIEDSESIVIRPLQLSRTPSPVPVTSNSNSAQSSISVASEPIPKLSVPRKKDIVIRCERLRREAPLPLETDLCGASKIRSCQDFSTTKPAETQDIDHKLHSISREDLETAMKLMDQWSADQLYSDWSTCCAIWYPSQNIKGETQWNHETPYGDIKIEEEAQAHKEENTNTEDILAQMKRSHTQQEARFQIIYPEGCLNDREKHRHRLCSCKHNTNFKRANNCAVRLTNIPSDITRHNIFSLIDTGAVACLHYFRCPPNSSGGVCKVVFKRPGSAAKLIRQSLKLGLFLKGNRITVAYLKDNCAAWQPSLNRGQGYQFESRVILIRGLSKPPFTVNEWKDFFGQVCKPDIERVKESRRSIVFFFTSIQQARICLKAAKQLPGHLRSFKVAYHEDPCEYQTE